MNSHTPAAFTVVGPDLEQLRREIAAKHGVLVGKDDPILMLVTANDFCLQRSVQLLHAAHGQALETQAQQLEHSARSWRVAAEQACQRSLDDTTNRLDIAAMTAAETGRKVIEDSVRTLIRLLQLALFVGVCSALLSLLASILLWMR